MGKHSYKKPKPVPVTKVTPKHSRTGNCWLTEVVYNCADCGVGGLCDVCHLHDEPRGSCSFCIDCKTCVEKVAP